MGWLELARLAQKFYLIGKTRENSNFLKMGKMVISIKIRNFSRSWIKKMDFTVGIVSQNLATTSNLVKLRDSRNFTFFEALGVGCHKTACEKHVM